MPGVTLAIAYVCVGQLPPSALVLETLLEQREFPVDEAIINAFKKSVALLGVKCSAMIDNA